MLVPDQLTVVADNKSPLYLSLGWVDESFPEPEKGQVIVHWVHVDASEHILPEYGQLMDFESAVQGRIGCWIAGGDYHLAIGKQVYDALAQGQTLFKVRDDLQGIPVDQLFKISRSLFEQFRRT